jgi:hypothetical protein
LASKIIVVAMAAGLLALAAILFTPSPAPAKPVISWEFNRIVETVARGTEKTTTVSFTSATNLTNVSVQITPALQPYISITPSSFSSVNSGDTVSLTFTFAAPNNAPLGSFDGTLHIRDSGKTKKTHANPIAVTLIVSAIETDPEGILNELINNLQTGNIESVLQKVAPSLHNQVRTLDNDTLNRLADSFTNRRLIKETSSLRIYTGPWVDEGGAQRDVEFTFALTELGEWKIISW